MAKPQPPPRRRHLAREDRRIALLDVAAEVVEKNGWPALSMISVASAAKVSRQLVYQHFKSVDELMTDTMAHIFSDIYEGTRSTIASQAHSVAAMVAAAENLTFDLAPQRARALWQILTATNVGASDAARSSRRIRHLVTKMWTPSVSQLFDVNEEEGSALAWMLVMAFWGAHQLVSDGEIKREKVIALYLRLLQASPAQQAAPVTHATEPAQQGKTALRRP